MMPIPSAEEISVPHAVAACALLDRVDYQDAFIIDTAAHATAEQWMRAIIEGSPRWFQLPWIYVLGRGVLRAKIGPLAAPGYVLGWKVIRDTPDTFAVGLDGAAGLRVRLITLIPPDHAVFATQIRFGPLPMRIAWPAIRIAHRFFAPFLVRRAAGIVVDSAP